MTFIFGCARSSLLCGLFSSCSEQAGFSLWWLLLLQGMSSVVKPPGLWSPGSVAVVHGLSWGFGIFLDQGSNLCSSTGKWILNH